MEWIVTADGGSFGTTGIFKLKLICGNKSMHFVQNSQ